MTALPDFGQFQSALAAHLTDVQGLNACHAFVRFDDDAWIEAARIGTVQPDLAPPILQDFAPNGGGAVSALPKDQGWLASYACSSGAVHLCLLFYLSKLPSDDLHRALEALEAKAGWLLVAAVGAENDRLKELDLPSDIGAAVLLEAALARNPRALADGWVARLERALIPDLVAVIWVDGESLTLAAQSGGGEVERPSRAIEALKDIAKQTVEDRSALRYTRGMGGQMPAKAQAKLNGALDVLGARMVLSLPIYLGDPCHAVTVALWNSSDRPLPSVEAADQIAQVLAQGLAIQQRAHPSIRQIARTWLMDLAIVLFGKRAAKVKLFALATAILLGALALIPTTARPAFEARIEARNRFVISAPFDGFLSEAPFQLGDSVAAGRTVLALDDADFRLQLARITAETQRLDGEIQTARSQRDTAKVRALDAQLRQAQVQVDLLTHQLEQTQLVALRAGVIVGGDAWRRVGGRVRLGEPLLEVADPESYAVAAYIDESWVADLPPSTTGKLLLAAFPSQPIPITLTQVTADASNRGGVNVFLAWADLGADLGAEANPELPLLEGMRGIVRLDGARMSVLRAYTRGLRQWLAKTLWAWG